MRPLSARRNNSVLRRRRFHMRWELLNSQTAGQETEVTPQRPRRFAHQCEVSGGRGGSAATPTTHLTLVRAAGARTGGLKSYRQGYAQQNMIFCDNSRPVV